VENILAQKIGICGWRKYREHTCIYCAQPHLSINCTVVTDVTKRKEILKRSGRCYACTMKNHISKTCQSRTRCSKCQGRHHTSICSQGKEIRRQEMRSVESQTVQRGKQNRDRNSTKPDQRNKDNTVPEESSTMCVNTKNAVLLQTAKATIY
jgi:hypothetical protein